MKTFGAMLEVARIQSEINRLFENLLDLGEGDKESGAWIPNVDVVEGEEMLVVKVELPGVEAADLTLAANAGRIVTKKQLLTEVWGPHSAEQSQYLRVYMTHLRRKLDPAAGIFRTEAGVGYGLECP